MPLLLCYVVSREEEEENRGEIRQLNIHRWLTKFNQGKGLKKKEKKSSWKLNIPSGRSCCFNEDLDNDSIRPFKSGLCESKKSN